MTTHLTKRDRQRAEYEAEARAAAKRARPPVGSICWTTALGERVELAPNVQADIDRILAGEGHP